MTCCLHCGGTIVRDADGPVCLMCGRVPGQKAVPIPKSMKGQPLMVGKRKVHKRSDGIGRSNAVR